jgi:hypothetical protein
LNIHWLCLNTAETAAPRPRRTVGIAGRSFLPLPLEASQQSAHVAFAVRRMMAANSFANQGSQFRRILLQIQILRLTESAAQCVANNLAGIIVEAAFDLSGAALKRTKTRREELAPSS